MQRVQEETMLTRELWAKTSPARKSLWHHMVDSGVCGEILAGDLRFRSATALLAEYFFLSEEETVRLISYVSSIHDCYGKAHPAFQKKSKEDAAVFFENGMISQRRDLETGYRHEKYGEKCYGECAQKLTVMPLSIIELIGSVIGLHHQGKNGHRNKPASQKEIWTQLADELHIKAIERFDPPLDKLQSCAHCDACVLLLSAFVILADWIASSEPFAYLAEENEEAYHALAKKTAIETIEKNGLHSNEAFPVVNEYNSLWPFLNENNLRNVQRAIQYDVCKDAELTIIEAPMGEGKTEAGAFYAARMCSLMNKQGLYFALPTSATSNQMYERMHKMLSHIQRNQPRLMHGMAWLVLSQANECSAADPQDSDQWDWLRPLRRAMLAESGVGTVDQAMMAALQIRYGCLRLLGLTGKVLVIDEIHAYDAYMSDIIERLLQWCKALKIPVVMLSATLTSSKRKALVEAVGAHLDQVDQAYPLITQVKNGQATQLAVHGTTKTGSFDFRPMQVWNDPQKIAAAALDKVSAGGCLCVMMNTVAEAQQVYKALKHQASSDQQIILFHARMKASHRDTIEKQCVELFGADGSKRPASAILVCTQVVEQSMDLDFDGMITCIAPIDLLLQRAGRVHRHSRENRPDKMNQPIIDVMVPKAIDGEAYDASGVIYDPWLLMQTHRILSTVVKVPEGIRPVIERVYADPENVAEEWAKKKFKDQFNSNQAKACELPEPDPEEYFGWNLSDGIFDIDDQNELVTAKTRLSEATVRVALLDKTLFDEAKVHIPSMAVAKKVLMNSFTIRAESKACEMYVRGNGLLRDVVLICEEELPVQIGDKTLHYDTDLGAILQRRESREL